MRTSLAQKGKRLVKGMLARIGYRIERIPSRAGEFPDHSGQDATSRIGEIAAVDKGLQILLSLKYKELLHHKLPLPSFEEVGFRVFSQNDEDGILLYIFSLIGTVNKKAVEICAGDGIECNTANLTINHGWTALLFDGNEATIRRGQDFYQCCKDTFLFPPRIIHAWIEAENVNTLISGHGFEGEIDLLSLDIDGVDYWIWKAIDCISPRVVILEYQDIWGLRNPLPFRIGGTSIASTPILIIAVRHCRLL